jgi:hypothetical protein
VLQVEVYTATGEDALDTVGLKIQDFFTCESALRVKPTISVRRGTFLASIAFSLQQRESDQMDGSRAVLRVSSHCLADLVSIYTCLRAEGHKHLQKRPLRSAATFHVVHIRRTSVQSILGEPLKQSAHPIRYTIRTYLRPLFVFLPGEVCPCYISMQYTDPSIPGEALRHLSKLSFIMSPSIRG